MLFGYNVSGTSSGLYIDSTNYIFDDNTFSLANGNVSWNGSTLSVVGSGTFTGTINAEGGTFTNNVTLNGTLTAGTAKFGTDVSSTNDGI
jgi:hypothetical protein